MNATTDWFHVSELSEGVTVITEAPTTLRSNVFVVEGDRDLLVIDTSIGVGDLRGLLETLFGKPSRVVLTHSHWDHIGNAYQFDDVAIHPLERTDAGDVTIDGLSDEFVNRPAQFVRDRRDQGEPFPDGFDPASFSIPPACGVGTVEEGDEITVGDASFEIYGIPGHSPGQVAVLYRDASVLFGADIVHVEKGLFALFQGSSFDAYVDSLEKVINLRDADAFETLLTAHNDPIRGDELGILDDLLDGLGAIDDGRVDHELIETPWGEAWRYTIGGSTVLTKPGLR